MPQIHERVHGLESGSQCWEGPLASRCKEHKLCRGCKEGDLAACAAHNSAEEGWIRPATPSILTLHQQQVQCPEQQQRCLLLAEGKSRHSLR